MGYYVRRLKNKKKAPAWKIQYVSCKREDQRSRTAKSPKRTWDIAKDRWRTLGFHASMTLEEVQVRVRQLNAQLHLKRQEERIKKLEETEEAFLKRHEAVLPDEFVSEFEARFVRPCGITAEGGGRRRLIRRYVTWRAAQKMITTIGMEPSDWLYHVHDIYDYFYQRQLSLSYVQGILKISNLWGHFISRKLCKPFWPIPMPKGYERQRMIEAYYQKEKWTRVPSKAITPEHLALLSGQINRPNFNWLYLSVWFGLRPQEIDSLQDKSMWRIEALPTGRKILWVYQTKIIALPPEDRWKPIPILFDEQHFALKIVESVRRGHATGDKPCENDKRYNGLL